MTDEPTTPVVTPAAEPTAPEAAPSQPEEKKPSSEAVTYSN